MTFGVKTTVHRNPKSDTQESGELLECIRDANAGAWLGYLRLKLLREWLQSVELDIQMSNEGTRPIELAVTLMILVPANFDPHTYKHEFRAGLPINQRKHFLQDWVANLSVEGMEHYFCRVHHSQKVKLENLEEIRNSLSVTR